TTGLAITLGVAFMVGTLVLADTISKTFNDLFADVYRGTDAVVRAEATFKDPQGTMEQRGRVDAALVARVGGAPGVKVAHGDVFGSAQIVDRHGDAVGNPQMGAPTVGGNWNDVAELNPWVFSAGGPPRADDEIVIDKKSADSTGYHVGDSVPVLVKGGPTTARLVGIVKFGTADSPGGASFVLFTTAAAQRLVAEPGRFDSISVVAAPGVSQTQLRDRIAAVLPAGTEALTGRAITAEAQTAINRAMSFFDNFLFIFAVIALLVGGFMIFNTFSITVARRMREHALLRAIGASRRQILVSVLLEALGVGVLASLLGLAAGLGVTVVAAVSPARKAGKGAPMAAIREVSANSARSASRRRVVVGATLLAAGVASLLYGLYGHPGNALATVGAGALAIFFGVSVLGEVVARPLSRAIGWPLPRLRGITGRLARENAIRNPKRTAATASALMIGVGLVGFITIFASSTKASVGQTVDRVYTGDLVVTGSAAFGSGGIDPSFARRAAALPEVADVATIRGAFVQVDGAPVQIFGSSPSAFDLWDVKPVAGSPSDLAAPDTIAVLQDKAEEKHLHIGDRVAVVFKDTGLQQLRVALIYGERQPAGEWLLGTATYDANVTDTFDFQVFVKKAPGTTSATALAALKSLASAYPGTKVFDQAGYKADQTRVVDQLLGLIYALLALAILIALLGIGNTLALSILERTRELGVMRAVRHQGLVAFSVPLASLAAIVVLAALAGVLAAVLPARRAARLNVLQAVVTE